MERWRLTISVLSICVAASALASCAASPSSPASSVAPADRPSERSWMLPEASGDTLLYLTSDFGGVNVLSYPSGKLVGTLSGVEYPIGVCADSGGNVFVTAYYTQDVIEYAHGGTTPIARLPDFGYHPRGCAVDPVSGNLAVANTDAMDGSGGNVAIYAGATGKPAYYAAPGISSFSWCAYDDEGDLFANGTQLAELRPGSASLTAISLSVSGDGVQWDGTNLAMIDTASKALYRISMSGSSGSVAGTMRFKGLIFEVGYDFLLTDGKAIVPFASFRDSLTKIGFWKYPQSGQHGRSFKAGDYDIYALALSPTEGAHR